MNVVKLAEDIRRELKKVIIGKDEIIDLLITTLIAEGHVLLEGYAGVGKTTIAKAFAKAIGGIFKRIQMTPDMLPADITGTYIFSQKNGDFVLKKGPIFANILLADELNRATPKTQAALLEAMQERCVTIEGVTLQLPRPFMVIATQLYYGGPGTYPLTDVQVDRFAIKIDVDNPSFDEELKIISHIDQIDAFEVDQVANLEDILKAIHEAKKVYVSEEVKRYILNLVNEVRASDFIMKPLSPRASIWLYKLSRARALMQGRDYVVPDDVKHLAKYVLIHRISLKPGLEEANALTIISDALDKVPVPKEKGS